MGSSNNLSLLMPNLQKEALNSSVDTHAVGEYMRGVVQGASLLAQAPSLIGRDLLQKRGTLRSLRQPLRESFHINWRPVVLKETELNTLAVCDDNSARLEHNRDVLLEEFLQKSSVKLYALVRTKRKPVKRQFGITLQPVVIKQRTDGVEDWCMEETSSVEQDTTLSAPCMINCSTPGLPLFGTTPMEGVPERLSARQPLSTFCYLKSFTPIEGVPEGRTPADQYRAKSVLKKLSKPFTPVEGVPEGRTPMENRINVVCGPTARCVSDYAEQSADSPIMGVIQESTCTGGDHHIDGRLSIASDGSRRRKCAGGNDALEYLKHDAFDYGGYNGTPSQLAGYGALRQCVTMADCAAQTGVSMEGCLEPNAAILADAGDCDHLDDFCGTDDFNDYDNMIEGNDNPATALPDSLNDPGLSHSRPTRRRQTINLGARLRNELGKRKSLGANPRCGRQEIAPGIRRSTRKKQEPLQWWRGEVKQFTREDHKTMPTVKEIVQKLPETPWKTVPDIRRPHSRRHQSAAADS